MATPDTLGAGDVEVLGASDVEVQGAKAPALSASDVDILSPNDVEMQGGAQRQPQTPQNGFPDLSKVAGAAPGMGRPATAAQVAGRRTPQPESVTQALADPTTQHNEAASTFGDQHEPTLQERQDAAGANYGFDPLKGIGDVARGARKISEGIPTFGANPQFGVFPTKEQKAAPVNASTAAQGANEVLGGTMEAGTGAFGEALARKPIQTALSLAAGYVSGDVAAVAAKKAGATPEEQEFAKTLAFFIPNAVATAAGVRTTEVAGPNGTRGAGVSAFGGRVGVGGVASEEAVGVGARVGPFSAQVVKPRGGGVEFSSNGPARLPDPGTSLAQEEAAATSQAIQQANALDAAAKNVAQGKPPIPQPPEPPKPEGMEQGVLKPETVQRVAQAISMAPAAARGQLVMEAHERLANWIAQQGRVMGPDGKIAIAKTPEQAQTIAAKWINDEVARQDQARNEAQKAQEQQQKEAAKSQEKAAQKPEVQQPPTLQQRAQTLIESSEKEKPEQVAKNIVRTLGIRYADALDMVKQARAGKASSIETGGLSITPEQKQAIDTQMDALKRGDVKAIHLPPESGYVPALPEGIKRVDVRKGPGAGTYLVKAGSIRAATIRAAAEAGTHEDLLAGKPLDTSDVEVQPATTAKVEAAPAQPERRSDLARRQRVAEMSPEQLRSELLTSEKTGLPNRRAFDEAEHAQPAGAVAQSDADGLKALNDKFGYAAGDALLKAKAEALRDAGLEAYHEKGDEFLYRGETPEGLQQKLEQARQMLRSRTIEVITPDGKIERFKGADFSYGSGSNLDEAESRLKAHKSEREARGERARGELRNIQRVAGEGLARRDESDSSTGRQGVTRGRPESGKPVLLGVQGEPETGQGTHVPSVPRGLHAPVGEGSPKDGSTPKKGQREGVRSVVREAGVHPAAPLHNVSSGEGGTAPPGLQQATADHLAVSSLPSRTTSDVSGRTKYEYGNTQAAIPASSEAAQALAAARSRIDKADLISTGYGGNDEGLETEPHVTLRYGLKGDDTAGIRAYLEQQRPFEATLGKTTSFPPSESSDGGAPIIAPVEAPELRRIESELDRHGDFVDRTFPEYKPHATLAYVKPEAAKKYEGMTETEGKRFRVESIEISNRDGSKETVPLQGKASEGTSSVRPAAEGAGGPAAPREGAGAEKPAAEAERPGQPESAVAERKIRLGDTVTSNGRKYIVATPDKDGNMMAVPANTPPGARLRGALNNGDTMAVRDIFSEYGQPLGANEVDAQTTQTGKGGRGESPEPHEGALEKGARVSFTDRSGQEHTGTIAHTDGRIARIKADDDKKSYSVAAGRVRVQREAKPGRYGEVGREFVATHMTPNAEVMPIGTVLPPNGEATTLKVIGYDGKTAVGKSQWYRFRVVPSSEYDARPQRIRYLDKSGKEQTGTVVRRTSLVTTVRGDDGTEQVVAARRVLGMAPEAVAARAEEVHREPANRSVAEEDRGEVAAGGRGEPERTEHSGGPLERDREAQPLDVKYSGDIEPGEHLPEIDEVHYLYYGPTEDDPDSDEYTVVGFRDGKGLFNVQVPAGRLAEVVGPVLAEKMTLGEGSVTETDKEAEATHPFRSLTMHAKDLNDMDTAWLKSMGIANGDPGETEYLHGGIGAVIPANAFARAAGPVLRFLNVPEEYEKVRTSRDLQQSLYDLDSQANADVLRAKRLLEEAPGTASDSEAVYHHLEDPSLPLTPTQQKLLDEYVAPLMEDTAEKVRLMREDGAVIDNYVHRIVKGRGSFIDRLLAGSKSTGKGNVLRKHIPSEKSRTMMALESNTGNRVVVSIKGDRVTAYRQGREPQDMGALSSGLTTRLEQLDQRLEPVVRDILKTKEQIAEVEQRDREDYLEGLEERIDQMKRDRDLVGEVKGRVPGQQSAHGVEVSFNKRASLSRQIEKAEKELEAYRAGTAEVQLSNRAKERIRRLNETLEVLRNQRGRLLEQVPTERMADKVWEDRNGKTWKITQATTKEIEAVTNLEYYHNALGSAIINWLAVEKQFRATEFLKNFTENPDFAKVGLRMDAGQMPPEGWRTTELAQLRGYYFEPHVAEVLDWYADRLKARQPGIYEKINNFLISSIFFNPLLHVPNILNHWAVEKGVSGWLDPRQKPAQVRAMVKAINAVIHQNDDFLAALDAGAALQSQQFGTHEYADLFLKRMQQQIEQEPTLWEKTAKLLGYANPLKMLDALKAVSSRVTWYSNDIAFLQSAYEKMARGMDLKVALRETAKHIPDYRLPTRILDSEGLARTLGNTKIVMFMHYHYGALRSYGEMLKSLATVGWEEAGTNAKGEPVNASGRTQDEEKQHGLDILAMLGLVTLVVYPLVDKMLRKASGDPNATMRRAGASTLPYNILQVARGEKSVPDALQSVVTPAVGLKAATELAMNQDLHTGRHIYTYPTDDWERTMGQVGSRLTQSFGPANELQRAGREGWTRDLAGMAGVTFPEHGAMKIASEIAANDADRKALSSDERAALNARYKALDALRAGDRNRAEELMRQAGLTRRQRHNLAREAHEDPLLAKVQHFTVEDLKTVYKHATAEERIRLGRLLRDKERRQRAESRR